MAFVFCFLIGSAPAETVRDVAGDEVIFTNGDRISGLIIKADREGIQLETSAFGLLTIAWTNVAHVDSHSRRWKLQRGSDDSGMQYADFKSAVLTRSDSNGRLMAIFDSQKVEVPEESWVELGNQEHQAPGPVVPPPAPPKRAAPALNVTLNSPVEVVNGSSSQVTVGGTLRVLANVPEPCKPSSWFTTMQLMALHNRAWKVKSAGVVTDIYDGNLIVNNGLGANGKFDAYITADFWGHSALGVGLQQSYGGGLSAVLYSTGCMNPKSYALDVTVKGGLRYIHQRLYAPIAAPLDLTGARMETSVTYQPFKKLTKDPLLAVQASGWAMPMINNRRAIQAGASAGVSFPLGKGLALAVTANDDFVNNAPKARKNYLTSGVSLTYSFPPPPKK